MVLSRDHPEGHNKIQDNYKSKLFVVVDHHNDPNVYIIQSLDKKGPKRTVNRQQLFDLKKSQVDPITFDYLLQFRNRMENRSQTCWDRYKCSWEGLWLLQE